MCCVSIHPIEQFRWISNENSHRGPAAAAAQSRRERTKNQIWIIRNYNHTLPYFEQWVKVPPPQCCYYDCDFFWLAGAERSSHGSTAWTHFECGHDKSCSERTSWNSKLHRKLHYEKKMHPTFPQKEHKECLWQEGTASYFSLFHYSTVVWPSYLLQPLVSCEKRLLSRALS